MIAPLFRPTQWLLTEWMLELDSSDAVDEQDEEEEEDEGEEEEEPSELSSATASPDEQVDAAKSVVDGRN